VEKSLAAQVQRLENSSETKNAKVVIQPETRLEKLYLKATPFFPFHFESYLSFVSHVQVCCEKIQVYIAKMEETLLASLETSKKKYRKSSKELRVNSPRNFFRKFSQRETRFLFFFSVSFFADRSQKKKARKLPLKRFRLKCHRLFHEFSTSTSISKRKFVKSSLKNSPLMLPLSKPFLLYWRNAEKRICRKLLPL
jgi:hypothetical protein